MFQLNNWLCEPTYKKQCTNIDISDFSLTDDLSLSCSESECSLPCSPSSLSSEEEHLDFMTGEQLISMMDVRDLFKPEASTLYDSNLDYYRNNDLSIEGTLLVAAFERTLQRYTPAHLYSADVFY